MLLYWYQFRWICNKCKADMIQNSLRLLWTLFTTQVQLMRYILLMQWAFRFIDQILQRMILCTSTVPYFHKPRLCNFLSQRSRRRWKRDYGRDFRVHVIYGRSSITWIMLTSGVITVDARRSFLSVSGAVSMKTTSLLIIVRLIWGGISPEAPSCGVPIAYYHIIF